MTAKIAVLPGHYCGGADDTMKLLRVVVVVLMRKSCMNNFNIVSRLFPYLLGLAQKKITTKKGFFQDESK